MMYVAYGNEEYEKGQYISQIVSRAGAVRIDYFAENGPRSVESLLLQDLFAGSQVIVMHDLLGQYPNEEQWKQMAESHNHILFAESKFDLRTKLAKQLLASSYVTTKEFVPPSLERLPLWVIEYATARRGSITESAARLLLQRLGYIDPLGGMAAALREPSLGRLSREIDKLLTYANGEVITEEPVTALIGDDRQVLTLSIADSLSRKNRAELTKLLESYYTEGGGEDDTSKTLALIGLLSEQFRSQLLVKDAMDRHVPEAEILALTGWKSGRLFMVKRLAGGFSVAKLKDILTKLENLDIELKTSTTPARAVLELILVQMV